MRRGGYFLLRQVWQVTRSAAQVIRLLMADLLVDSLTIRVVSLVDDSLDFLVVQGILASYHLIWFRLLDLFNGYLFNRLPTECNLNLFFTSLFLDYARRVVIPAQFFIVLS